MISGDWEHVARIASWTLGWFYFFVWSVSFFPQPMLNIRRRTTHGLTPDFPLLNVFGFACYTLSTSLLLFSRSIREQYALRHPLSPSPTVRMNDVTFGSIGLTLSIVTYSQFWPRLWRWERSPGVRRHANTATLGLIVGSLMAIGITTAIVLVKHDAQDLSSWAWLDVVYATEYVKLLMTVFKYVPQVVANFQRRSTIGWSITQQLLDFSGGIGSLLQLIIDSSLQSDWSGLTGNPLKLGLANISLIFDAIFIFQHFILFGPVEERAGAHKTLVEDTSWGASQRERDPLLSSRSDRAG